MKPDSTITAYCEECGKGLTENTLMLKTVIKRTPWGREPEVIVVCKGRCSADRFYSLTPLVVVKPAHQQPMSDAATIQKVAEAQLPRLAASIQHASREQSGFRWVETNFIPESRPIFVFVGKLKNLMRKLKELVKS